MNTLYTFARIKFLKLLLLPNISNHLFQTLGIYFLGTLLLYVTLFYLLRPIVRRFDNPLPLLILSVI